MARPDRRRLRFFRHAMPGFLILAASLILAACQMARMALPTNLAAGAQEMACRGRQGFKFNEAFTFLPFKVFDVHRSWTTIQGWDDAWIDSARAKQRYQFSVEEPGRPAWDGQCAVGAEFTTVELRRFFGGELEIQTEGIQTVLGLLKERGGKKPWKLVLGQQTGEMSMSGVLERDDIRVAIEAQHRLAQTPLPVHDAAGYILTQKRKAVAAVEVLNNGAVWIDPQASPEMRGALAAAASALLLFQDLLSLNLDR